MMLLKVLMAHLFFWTINSCPIPAFLQFLFGECLTPMQQNVLPLQMLMQVHFHQHFVSIKFNTGTIVSFIRGGIQNRT